MGLFGGPASTPANTRLRKQVPEAATRMRSRIIVLLLLRTMADVDAWSGKGFALGLGKDFREGGDSDSFGNDSLPSKSTPLGMKAPAVFIPELVDIMRGKRRIYLVRAPKNITRLCLLEKHNRR